jgi:hypothetical protein
MPVSRSLGRADGIVTGLAAGGAGSGAFAPGGGMSFMKAGRCAPSEKPDEDLFESNCGISGESFGAAAAGISTTMSAACADGKNSQAATAHKIAVRRLVIA